jgi:hypothetical protein
MAFRGSPNFCSGNPYAAQNPGTEYTALFEQVGMVAQQQLGAFVFVGWTQGFPLVPTLASTLMTVPVAVKSLGTGHQIQLASLLRLRGIKRSCIGRLLFVWNFE